MWRLGKFGAEGLTHILQGRPGEGQVRDGRGRDRVCASEQQADDFLCSLSPLAV